MGEILMKVWFFIAVLPFILVMEGWKLLSNFLTKRNLWWAVPYYLLVILIILAIILWLNGYR